MRNVNEAFLKVELLIDSLSSHVLAQYCINIIKYCAKKHEVMENPTLRESL